MSKKLSSIPALTWALALVALIGAGGGTALAQQSDAKPDAATTQPASPGTGPGSGTGSPKAAGRSGPQWWGSQVTPGWSLMTWTERNEHRKQMRSFKTYEDCHRYLEEHHAKMAERAKAKGKPELAPPERDACVGLKP